MHGEVGEMVFLKPVNGVLCHHWLAHLWVGVANLEGVSPSPRAAHAHCIVRHAPALRPLALDSLRAGHFTAHLDVGNAMVHHVGHGADRVAHATSPST